MSGPERRAGVPHLRAGSAVTGALDLARAAWRALPGATRRRIVHALNHRFPVGVVGLIHDGEGKVLLLEHRFRFPYPWGLPGGFIGFGETFEAALARELREELRAEPRSIDPHPLDVELNTQASYVSVTLAAELAPGPFTFSGEITGGGFFGPGELPAGTYPHQARIVERFFDERRTSLRRLRDPT